MFLNEIFESALISNSQIFTN